MLGSSVGEVLLNDQRWFVKRSVQEDDSLILWSGFVVGRWGFLRKRRFVARLHSLRDEV